MTRAATAAPALTVTDPTIPLGRPGLKEFGGILYEEPKRELSGRDGVRTYSDMMNDAIVGAGILVIKLFMRQVDWRIDSASDDPVDVAARDWLESVWRGMDQSWSEALDALLTCVEQGWSVSEILYVLRDGFYVWEGFELRPQDTLNRWEMDDRGRAVGMWQDDPKTWRSYLLPLEKALHVRLLSHKTSPEGRALLRQAYEAHYYKTQTRRFEGIGIERRLSGMPRIKLPALIMAPSATAEQKQTYEHFKNMGTQVRLNRQACVIMPSDRDEAGNLLYEFDLVTSDGSSAVVDTDTIINRYNKEIAISMLVDVILVGHENVGSYSLASSKTNLLSLGLGAYLDAVADALNRQAVARLFALNPQVAHGEHLPKFCHGDVETVDWQELAEKLKALTLGGVDITDEATQMWLRKQAGLPEVAPGSLSDEDVVDDEDEEPAPEEVP